MGTLSGEAILPFSLLPSSSMGSTLNPIALRKAKIVYNFGLSECNRVKRKEQRALLSGEDKKESHTLFPFVTTPILIMGMGRSIAERYFRPISTYLSSILYYSIKDSSHTIIDTWYFNWAIKRYLFAFNLK